MTTGKNFSAMLSSYFYYVHYEAFYVMTTFARILLEQAIKDLSE